MAIQTLDAQSSEDLVLNVLRLRLQSRLETRTSAARRLFGRAFRTWGDKYAVTLHELEIERDAAAARLGEYMKELGYV
jgi:type I restriction enzyme M protein